MVIGDVNTLRMYAFFSEGGIFRKYSRKHQRNSIPRHRVRWSGAYVFVNGERTNIRNISAPPADNNPGDMWGAIHFLLRTNKHIVNNSIGGSYERGHQRVL